MALIFMPLIIGLLVTQPLYSHATRLFSFARMRSEGRRLDCPPSLQGMCSEEQKELKAFMLSFNLLQRLSLLSDLKIKKYRFKCFLDRPLTNEV